MPMTPEPLSTNVVCKACGLDWAKHVPGRIKADSVTLETCVKLLKAELATRPTRQFWSNLQTTGSSLGNTGTIQL